MLEIEERRLRATKKKPDNNKRAQTHQNKWTVAEKMESGPDSYRTQKVSIADMNLTETFCAESWKSLKKSLENGNKLQNCEYMNDF